MMPAPRDLARIRAELAEAELRLGGERLPEPDPNAPVPVSELRDPQLRKQLRRFARRRLPDPADQRAFLGEDLP